MGNEKDHQINNDEKVQEKASKSKLPRGNTGISISFSPQQAHTFGGQCLFLSFINMTSTLREEFLYYVIFEGSIQRHITSTKVLNPFTLEAVVPDHNEAELVHISVCKVDPNNMTDELQVLASDTFVFTSDSAQFLAHELAMNANNSSGILQLQSMYSSSLDVSPTERKELDNKLVTSFRHMKLSNEWNIRPLSEQQGSNESQWTLLHFCARYNFCQFADYLLHQRGANEALKSVDSKGRTPCDIAVKKKNKVLIEILSRVPCEEHHQTSETVSNYPNIKRHKLGTTTITNQVTSDADDIVKDLMLLKELDTLASSTKGVNLQNGELEQSPLVESLKKLQEINDEIRRLRTLSYKESIDQYEDDMENGNEFLDYDVIEEINSNSFGDVTDGNSTLESISDITTTTLETGAVQEYNENTNQNIEDHTKENTQSRVEQEERTENASLTSDVTLCEENQIDKNDENIELSNSNDLIEKEDNVLPESEENNDEDEEKLEVLDQDKKPDQDEKPDRDERPEQSEKPSETDNLLKPSETDSSEIIADELDGGVECKNTNNENSINPQCLPESEPSLISEVASTEKSDVVGMENEDVPSVLQNVDVENEICDKISKPDKISHVKELPIIKRVASVEKHLVDEQKTVELVDDSFDTVEVPHFAELHEVTVSEVTISSANESPTEGTPGAQGDVNFNVLESVLEETEEELKAVRSGKSPKVLRTDGLVSITATRSLTELPPQPPKSRLSILRRQNAKKERPLSDSFENLKMVEHRGIFFHGDENKLAHGHSLDSLKDLGDGDANGEKTDSQLSVTEHQLSQESISSDTESGKSESGKSVSRSNSGKSITSTQRAVSCMSLNDLLSQEDLSPKRGSILNRLSKNKKAKSMTSLDMKEDQDRHRKSSTLQPNFVNGQSKVVQRTGESKELINEGTYGDILFHCESYDETAKKTIRRPIDVDNHIQRERKTSMDYNERSHSTSHLSEKRDTVVMRKKSSEKRKGNDHSNKGVFNIFGKPKEKKDKEKSKKVPGKSDAQPIQESKTSFLSKRGTSFRQNLKSVSDSKTNNKYAKHENFDRLKSDRKSPVLGRKQNAMIPENGELTNDFDANNAALNKNLSSSRTSLDSFGPQTGVDDTDYTTYYDNSDPFGSEYDSELDAKEEPETWNELVDKKVQKKMHAKDIKRQDVIYELIQTEAVYVRILYIMKKIYANTMLNTMQIDQELINTIFPYLDELIALNGNFLSAMKARQEESPNSCIEDIGDILLDFFGGETGENLKYVYGYFCSHHLEAVAAYKEIMKNDRGFVSLMRKCLVNERSRRLSIPECITYVTIRMTKYPLLIEAIIKATKESKPDYEKLKKSLILVKEVLHAVDDAVEVYEQEKELQILRKSVDRKFAVEIKVGPNKTVYKPSHLFNRKSRLLLDKKTALKGKNKVYDARMIILTTKIIFFQENGGKLQLLSFDNKAPVLSLKNVLVKEVATDNKALFLVSTSKEAAQIYEIGCDSYKDKKDFQEKLTRYIRQCPDEEEGNNTSDEEEAIREEEERLRKLKELIEQLQLADDKVTNAVQERNRLAAEMREHIEMMDEVGLIKIPSTTELKPADVKSARSALETCLHEVNTLSYQMSTIEPTVNHSPSPTLNTSSLNTSMSVPSKRAETFSNYDRGMKSSLSSSSVNRAVSLNPRFGRPGSNLEVTDSAKSRRQSQFMSSMLGRTKTMGSTEDISSLSSSHSSISLVSTQLQLFQSLRDRLTDLMDVTNKQDTEVANMRKDLQETRVEITKLKTERKELEEKLLSIQKESDKQARLDRDQYGKLKREFRRTVENLTRQLDDKKRQCNQLIDINSELNQQYRSSPKPNNKNSKQSAEILL